MRIQIARMQQQITEQSAQLSLLTGFVRDALTHRLDEKLESFARQIKSDQNKS